MSLRVALFLLAFTVGGCGANGSSGEEVAKSWVSAVDAEDWQAACALMVASKTPCEKRLDVFAGRSVRLLAPGGYSNGGETTDNKTRFAVATDKEDTGYFEITGDAGRPRVDLQITVEAYDGP